MHLLLLLFLTTVKHYNNTKSPLSNYSVLCFLLLLLLLTFECMFVLCLES